MPNHRKLTIGQGYRFWWYPPNPSGPADQGTAASLTVYWPSGSVSYTLNARTPDTVTAISADRRILTVDWGDEGSVPTGTYTDFPAPCWLTSPVYDSPVRISRMVAVLPDPDTGATFELAEQLPSPVGGIVDSGASLHWLGQYVDIPSTDLPAAPIRAVRWEVLYTPTVWGQAAPSGLIDRGVLAVTWAPFDTGLSDSALARIAPWTSTSRPPGCSSWADQISAGLDYLVSRIQPELPSGVWEDDLVGQPWLRAHAIATQIIILQDLIAKGVDRLASLEAMQRDFDAEVKLRIARPEWADYNQNNVIDSGETVLPATTVVFSHISDPSVFDSTDTDARLVQKFRRFRVGDSM